MNAHFVCIKVDREERPDVDQVYMDAVQLMTRQGGWPLNCIALPDGRPIWGSVYLPKTQWLSSLQAIVDVQSDHPGRVGRYAEKLTAAVEAMGQPSPPEASSFHDAFDTWSQSWDLEHGGRIGAPNSRCRASLNSWDARPIQPTWDLLGESKPATTPCAPWTPWWLVASTTMSEVGLRGTASTKRGTFRILKRCCTTTRSWCPSFRRGQTKPIPNSRKP